MSVEFSAAELAKLSAQIEGLNQQLAELDEALASAGSADDGVEQLLAATNVQIFELRRQWRCMLKLPPPKPLR